MEVNDVDDGGNQCAEPVVLYTFQAPRLRLISTLFIATRQILIHQRLSGWARSSRNILRLTTVGNEERLDVEHSSSLATVSQVHQHASGTVILVCFTVVPIVL